MKYTKCLLFSLTSLLVISASVTPVLNSYLLTDTMYGGSDGQSDINMKFIIKNPSKSNYMTIAYRYLDTNANFINYRYDMLESDIQDNVITLDYVLETRGRMDNGGIKLQIYIKTNKNRTVFSKNIILYKRGSHNIVSTQYRDEPYIITRESFALTEPKGNLIEKEGVQFADTIDTLTYATDNSLDLSEISFTYMNGFSLQGYEGDSYLVIKDNANMFDMWEKTNSLVMVPLKILQDNENISFDFRDLMYYRDGEYHMSNTPLFGHRNTHKFYLPPDRLNDLAEEDVWIECHDFGRSKMSIKIPLQFDGGGKGFFGSCDSSSYCINGGVKE